MYHRSGGGGVQLTTRRTQQKDSGEPAFSPDGRYLYFSDDNTPGETFEYSKDVNGEIYVIQRLDRETGEVEEFLGGPGRVDPADAVAGRQELGLHPPRPLPVDPLRDGHRERARDGRSIPGSTATCRRPGRSTASIRP